MVFLGTPLEYRYQVVRMHELLAPKLRAAMATLKDAIAVQVDVFGETGTPLREHPLELLFLPLAKRAIYSDAQEVYEATADSIEEAVGHLLRAGS